MTLLAETSWKLKYPPEDGDPVRLFCIPCWKRNLSMSNELKLYGADTLRGLSTEAARSPRRRKNLNVHPVLEDPVQRLFNALEPGTYACPHRHARDNGWELMVVVRGAFALLCFDLSSTGNRVPCRPGSVYGRLVCHCLHANFPRPRCPQRN